MWKPRRAAQPDWRETPAEGSDTVRARTVSFGCSSLLFWPIFPEIITLPLGSEPKLNVFLALLEESVPIRLPNSASMRQNSKKKEVKVNVNAGCTGFHINMSWCQSLNCASFLGLAQTRSHGARKSPQTVRRTTKNGYLPEEKWYKNCVCPWAGFAMAGSYVLSIFSVFASFDFTRSKVYLYCTCLHHL